MARDEFCGSSPLFLSPLNLLGWGTDEFHPRVAALVLNSLNAVLHLRNFGESVSCETYYLNIKRARRNLNNFSNKLAVHTIALIVESSPASSSAFPLFMSSNKTSSASNFFTTTASTNFMDDKAPPPLTPRSPKIRTLSLWNNDNTSHPCLVSSTMPCCRKRPRSFSGYYLLPHAALRWKCSTGIRGVRSFWWTVLTTSRRVGCNFIRRNLRVPDLSRVAVSSTKSRLAWR